MKKFAILSLLGLLLISCGCSLPLIRAERKVTRIGTVSLTQDTVWDGDILVDGVVTVPSGVTLTIRPGTIIRFEPVADNLYGSGHGLIIQGTLNAVGSKRKKIIFTSAADKPAKGDWNDIFFLVSEGEGNILDHCVIEYANVGVHGHFARFTVKNSRFTNNWRAFQIQEAEVAIINNLLKNNQYGIRFRDSEIELSGNELSDMYSGIETFRSEIKIIDNTVRNCYITSVKIRESEVEFRGNVIENCRRGLQINDSSKVKISRNKFIANLEHGVALKNSDVLFVQNEVRHNGGDGISVSDTFLQAGYNNIVENGKYAIDNNSELGVDARNNWWGSSALVKIGSLMYDYYDEESLGRVEFTPILLKPVKTSDVLPLEVINP